MRSVVPRWKSRGNEIDVFQQGSGAKMADMDLDHRLIRLEMAQRQLPMRPIELGFAVHLEDDEGVG